MIISVADELLNTIGNIEALERKRTKSFEITFCWTYAPNGTGADGLAFQNGIPFRQFDVALLSPEVALISERPIYDDFEIQWEEHPLNTGSLDL